MHHLEPTWSTPLGSGVTAHVIVTDRSHGDLAVGQEGAILRDRQRRIADAPWSWLRQVHGGDVVAVPRPGAAVGVDADALWTSVIHAPIAVQTADCAPVCIVGANGVVAVAHAGWRGLMAGVIEATVRELEAADAGRLDAVLGPCIRPGSYAFGPDDLEEVEARFGPGVRGTTHEGEPALDIPATVEAALALVGVPLVARLGGCTATEATVRWSHRSRGDTERQAMVAWLGPSGSTT